MNLPEEDVDGEFTTDDMRQMLTDVFYHLARRFARSNGSTEKGAAITSWLDNNSSLRDPRTCSDDESERGSSKKKKKTAVGIIGLTKPRISSSKSVDIIVEPEAAADVL